METQKKQAARKRVAILLILVLGLCIAGIVMTAMGQQSLLPNGREILTYIGYVLVLYYAFFGYRIPHGNLLRYTMLLFAVLLIVMLVCNPSFYGNELSRAGMPEETQLVQEDGEIPEEPAENVPLPPSGEPDVPEKPKAQTPGEEKRSNLLELSFLGTVILLASYMAGRLNKIKQNQIIVVLVALIFLARAILVNNDSGRLPFNLNELNMWIVLSCSYLLRYRDHKEAGLLDR